MLHPNAIAAITIAGITLVLVYFAGNGVQARIVDYLSITLGL